MLPPLRENVQRFDGLEELDVPSCRIKIYDIGVAEASFALDLHRKVHPVAHAHLAELLRRKRRGKRALLSRKKPNFILVLDKFFRRVWWCYQWTKEGWERTIVMPPLSVIAPCRLVIC
jgi:hypothetical protein